MRVCVCWSVYSFFNQRAATQYTAVRLYMSSQRSAPKPSAHLPPMTLLALSDLFRRSVSIDAKRKIDGEKAESRQGATVSTHWLNERFRQTLLLIREFRYNWVTGEMLTNDDIEFLRICLDVALGQAAQHRRGLREVLQQVVPELQHELLPLLRLRRGAEVF